MEKLEGVAKLQGTFMLYLKHPTQNLVFMLDDRWKVEKIDETHYRVSPSFKVNYGREDWQDFHTTNPFIIEIVETKLTEERYHERAD